MLYTERQSVYNLHQLYSWLTADQADRFVQLWAVNLNGGGSLMCHGMNSKMLTDRKVAQQVEGQGPLWTYLSSMAIVMVEL